MELKTLVLGIFMSTLAFALKSGGGMTYLFSRSPNVRLQLLFSVLFAVGYGLVFGAAALLIHQVDLTAHLDLLQEFFKSGMTVHLIVAGLLLIWGIGLLRQPPSQTDTGAERGAGTWIALVVPCPVCFSVILLSMGFVTALYPDVLPVAAALYTGFVLVSLTVAFGGAWLLKRGILGGNAEQSLGTLMLLIAVYFLLSVIIVPQFVDLERIYRISLSDDPVTMTGDRVLVITITIIAFAAGFFNFFKRKV